MVVAEWWLDLDGIQRVFWSIALVSSVLLFILMAISLYGQEADKDAGRDRKRSRLREPKTILMGLTLLGWTGILVYSLSQDLFITLSISLFAAVLGAALPWWLAPFLKWGRLDPETARSSTGKVLRSVPPNRNGFGKVHLNLRAAPYQLDAVTAGEELLPGAMIRVVEIIDDRVVLVEAVDRHASEERGPHPTDVPPAPRGPAA